MADNVLQLQSGRPNMAADRAYAMAHTFDLAGLATGDVLYAFTIPAGHKVVNVSRQVIAKADATTPIANIGIYTDQMGTAVANNDFGSADALNATVGTIVKGIAADAAVAAFGYVNGLADTYIGVLINVTGGPLTTGSYRLVVECVDCT